jgi:hypothetical protein
MCVRLAHIISEISCLPGRLLKSRDVEQVKQWYITSFRELMEFEPVARSSVEQRGMYAAGRVWGWLNEHPYPNVGRSIYLSPGRSHPVLRA